MRTLKIKAFGYGELTDASKKVAIANLNDAGVKDIQEVLNAEFTAGGVYIDPAFLKEAA